jgi:hypothetical protein
MMLPSNTGDLRSALDERTNMDENPFKPDLYTAQQRGRIQRAVTALGFVLFFVVTVPLWLWRTNRFGRALAVSWLLVAAYLSYGLHVYAQSGQFATLSLSVFTRQLANQATADAGQTDVLPQIDLLASITPTPVRRSTPAPLPTVTPWTDNPHWAVVTQGRLNLRAAPTIEGDIIGKLTAATCVEVTTLSPDWLELRLATGEQGWSAREFLELVSHCPPGSVP